MPILKHQPWDPAVLLRVVSYQDAAVSQGDGSDDQVVRPNGSSDGR